MPANANWPRWIFASISKHIDNQKGSLPLYIEGQERNTKIDTSLLELRVDGPYFTELSKGSYLVEVDVSILVQVLKDAKDAHLMQKTVGTVATMLTDIQVFMYGSGIQDSPTTSLGCLQLLQDGRDRTAIHHYGQMDPSVRLMQASVDAKYKMYLDN